MQQPSKQSSAKDNIWYRNAMVWMIILLPLSVVVASMITIYIAHKNAPEITPSARLQSASQINVEA